MINCTRRIEFDAGHRVTRHESKCRHVHGHRYAVEITAEANELDHAGRVIDFGVLKGKVGGWIDAQLDHGYIMHPHDPVGSYLVSEGFKVFEMPEELGEPTAENLATLIGEMAELLVGGDGLRITRVVLWETPNCKAEWKP